MQLYQLAISNEELWKTFHFLLGTLHFLGSKNKKKGRKLVKWRCPICMDRVVFFLFTIPVIVGCFDLRLQQISMDCTAKFAIKPTHACRFNPRASGSNNRFLLRQPRCQQRRGQLAMAMPDPSDPEFFKKAMVQLLADVGKMESRMGNMEADYRRMDNRLGNIEKDNKSMYKRMANIENDIGYLTESSMISEVDQFFGSEFTQRVVVTALSDLIPFATLNAQTPFPKQQALLRKLELHTLKNLVPFMEYLPSFLHQAYKGVIFFTSNGRLVPDIVSVLGKVLQSGNVPKAKEDIVQRVLWLFVRVDELNVEGKCIFKKGQAVLPLLEGAKVDLTMEDSNSASNQELSSLLSDPLGPGLMIFLWSSAKGSRFQGHGVIQSEIEFDCRGRIAKNLVRDHENQYVIEVAEIKRNVKEADGDRQLVLRLRLLPSTLKVALGASNFVLKGYRLFRNGAVQAQHREALLEPDDPYPIQLIKMRVKRGQGRLRG